MSLMKIISLILLSNHINEGKIVEYDLTVRSIVSNPDGYPRSVVIIHHTNNSWDKSRPIPGPTLRGEFGDFFRILIRNELRDQSTSIHFHGLHMYENVWSDGTEHITQCPIPPHETFLYEFNITQTGTFWYHSHNGQQYADGLIGAIIIAKDPIELKYSYDPSNDYILMFEEWYHETWNDLMTGYQGPHDSYEGYKPFYPWPPTSFLINGHGNFHCKEKDCLGNETWKDQCGIEYGAQCIPLRSSLFGQCQKNLHPFDEFSCPYQKQIRLRLINAASGIPFRFTIEKHQLRIVARDSLEIVPINVSYVHIPIGQRLDIIVHCNEDPSLNYRMILSSRNSFHPIDMIRGPTPTMWTESILSYQQISKSHFISRSLMNNIKLDDDINPENPFFEYEYFKPVIGLISPPAIKRFQLSFVVHWNNRNEIDSLEEWAVNNITFLPPKQPLLQGIYLDHSFDDIIADSYEGRVHNIHQTHIIHMEYNQTYEILLINNDPQQHPWHVHGYTLDFIQAGKLPYIPQFSCNQSQQELKKESLNDLLPLMNESVPIITRGDSFNIPRESYVLFRMKTNNIGPWFVHCHMDWHISPGMALVFSVEYNHKYKSAFLQAPSSSFPLCGLTFRSISSSSNEFPFQENLLFLLFFWKYLIELK